MFCFFPPLSPQDCEKELAAKRAELEKENATDAKSGLSGVFSKDPEQAKRERIAKLEASAADVRLWMILCEANFEARFVFNLALGLSTSFTAGENCRGQHQQI